MENKSPHDVLSPTFDDGLTTLPIVQWIFSTLPPKNKNYIIAWVHYNLDFDYIDKFTVHPPKHLNDWVQESLALCQCLSSSSSACAAASLGSCMKVAASFSSSSERLPNFTSAGYDHPIQAEVIDTSTVPLEFCTNFQFSTTSPWSLSMPAIQRHLNLKYSNRLPRPLPTHLSNSQSIFNPSSIDVKNDVVLPKTRENQCRCLHPRVEFCALG